MSCRGCGAPPEPKGCSYCGRGRKAADETGYYEGMSFDEWLVLNRPRRKPTLFERWVRPEMAVRVAG